PAAMACSAKSKRLRFPRRFLSLPAAPASWATSGGARSGRSRRYNQKKRNELGDRRRAVFLLGECPLSGVKRTCACAPQMSAFDPKRTSTAHPLDGLTSTL